MGQQNKVSKKQPTKDGRNAKQRRADKKRAERLANAAHLNHVWTSLKNEKLHQSHRWVTHNMKTGDILGYQNEIRWGLKTGVTHLLSDEAQSSVERLDRERKAALGRLNRAKKAANPSAKKEVWVDDWFGEANVESVGTDAAGAGAGVSVGAEPVDEDSEGVEAVEIEQTNEDEEGKDADGGEVLDDSDCMSGVEMG